jgi:uncharacterized membrane-anchored protein
MIRAALLVLVVVAVAVAIIALRGEPGAADITWFHWNVRTTAAAATMLLIFFTLAAALFWRGLIWIAEAPRRAARARAEATTPRRWCACCRPRPRKRPATPRACAPPTPPCWAFRSCASSPTRG